MPNQEKNPQTLIAMSKVVLPRLKIIITMVTMACLNASTAMSAEEVDYSRDVLPILANKCFVCHGPDSHPDTDLRLDTESTATEDRGGYSAIDPKRPEKSELLKRIQDSADPMPPADAEKQLTDSERDILNNWVRQGGNYESHWAWIKPSKEKPYSNSTKAIDAFIGGKLKERGLQFAEQASKSTLARRVSLVLTGLPPEPEWLQDYLEDNSADAYETLVDRLLSNSRYGEHQARYWLDAVRYGDTHGLHLDNRRGIYPYRDWVVRALNDNLPFDEFITWQLAGDLVNSPTLEQKLATGFVRMNPSTGEGGAIADEFQMKNNFDRVETFGTVFLGLSLTCARCHTHKYDPIEQREYYELLAFFNNTNEPPLDGNSYTYGTTIAVPKDQHAWDSWKRLEHKASQLIDRHFNALPNQDADYLVEYATATNGWKMSDWKSAIHPTEQLREFSESGSVQKSRSIREPIQGFPGTVSAKQADGRLPSANQIMELSVVVETAVRQTIDVQFSGSEASKLSIKDIERSNTGSEADEGDQPKRESITVSSTSEPGTLQSSIDLKQGKHLLVFEIVATNKMDAVTVQLTNRWNPLAKNKSWRQCDLPQKLLMIADPNGPTLQKLTAEATIKLREDARGIAESINDEKKQFTTSLVAAESLQPRSTRMLRRGEYDSPIGDELHPSTPSILAGWSEDFPENRLGLARWVTSTENPLVSRVLVNRIWQRVFGLALVRTPEDFGVQGQQPTHPELLDWLSVDFIETGWDLKRLLKSMVISQTFKQAAGWRDELDDPENRLLARASSYRLDAEVLRDLGLWASHQLDPAMGGEGIKPYQPQGMWAALAHPASNTKKYQRDTDNRRHRRSLYVYWKRTSPHPMMTLFDAPDRESSCVRRSRTNTPLQSLGMLNETQRVEIGQAFAKHLIESAESEQDRINLMFQTVTCRPPTNTEAQACRTLLAKMRVRYENSVDDAQQLLSLGGTGSSENHSSSELAAWSVLSTTFLASDLVIMLY